MIRAEIPALHRGRRRIVAPVTLTFAPGEIAGLVGPNGAGKSTLLRALAGLAAEPCRIDADGRALSRRDIGYLPQDFTTRSALSVLDCVLLGRREALGVRVPAGLIAEAQELLDTLALAALADRAMASLSGGQQQRVLIAQRLFRAPKLLVLDEPTSALDLHHQIEAMEQLRERARKTGLAVVAALHDLTLALRYCDRAIVLAGGAIRADAPAAEALDAPMLRRYWGVEAEFLASRCGAGVIVPHRL